MKGTTVTEQDHDDTDLDTPADVESEDNPLRDQETGEPVDGDDIDG